MTITLHWWHLLIAIWAAVFLFGAIYNDKSSGYAIDPLPFFVIVAALAVTIGIVIGKLV